MNLFNDIESLEEARLKDMIPLDIYINEKERLEKEGQHGDTEEKPLSVGDLGQV